MKDTNWFEIGESRSKGHHRGIKAVYAVGGGEQGQVCLKAMSGSLSQMPALRL